jgi:hypothetical protein
LIQVTRTRCLDDKGGSPRSPPRRVALESSAIN